MIRYTVLLCVTGQTVGVCSSPPTAASPWEGELPSYRTDVLPQLS